MKHYSSVGGGGGGAHNDNKFSYAYVPYRRARIKQEQRYNTHLARLDARWKKKKRHGNIGLPAATFGLRTA